jgi:PAS domain-containing protein
MQEDDSPCDPTEGVDEDLPDLTAFLNSDPHPTFIVPIDLAKPIPFRIAFANVAFYYDHQLKDHIIANNAASIAFQSWAQAVVHWRSVWNFGTQSWTAFTLQDKWKVVRMVTIVATPRPSRPPSPEPIFKSVDVSNLQKEAFMADAQVKSLRRMMAMSDVGVFEYDITGTLIRANDSWYKLSHHPRDMKAHRNFSFMDLVYPEDSALVISQWNKLVQKEPITFEMRWKAPKRPSPTSPELMEDFQWVLSACVPVLDDEGNVVSIAGNTIDISAQKRLQEVQRKRVEEALEAKRQAQNFIDMTNHEVSKSSIV